MELREALHDPESRKSYALLLGSYLMLNRVDEAQTMSEEALSKKLDSPALRFYLYELGFLKNDASRMAQEVAWSSGKSGVEDLMLVAEADTAAYWGRLAKARELSTQAVVLADQSGEKETAAAYEAEAALREALFRNAAGARQWAAAALGLSNGRDTQYGAALAVASLGDAARSQTLTSDLAKRFPEDTIVQFNYLPTLRAQLALIRNDSSKAIEVLQIAIPYELGVPFAALSPALYPVYVRGTAHLAALHGSEVADNFQKILDHPGVVQNEPIGALAHLGLARAYVLQHETAKARAKYQDFLTLWKDADPDIPILKQAKAEYAKLQ